MFWLTDPIFHWFVSYFGSRLSNRDNVVSIWTHLRKPCEIIQVPKGSILSSLLFKLCIYKLVQLNYITPPFISMQMVSSSIFLICTSSPQINHPPWTAESTNMCIFQNFLVNKYETVILVIRKDMQANSIILFLDSSPL